MGLSLPSSKFVNSGRCKVGGGGKDRLPSQCGKDKPLETGTVRGHLHLTQQQFPPPSPQCLAQSRSGEAAMTASVEIMAPDDARAPCAD